MTPRPDDLAAVVPTPLLVVRDGSVAAASPAATALLGHDPTGADATTVVGGELPPPGERRRTHLPRDGRALVVDLEVAAQADGSVVVVLTDRTREAVLDQLLGAIGDATLVVRDDEVDVLHSATQVEGGTSIEQVMAGFLHPDDLVEALDVLAALGRPPHRRDDRCYRIHRPGTDTDDWVLGDIVGVHVPDGPVAGTVLHVRLIDDDRDTTTALRLSGLSLADAAPLALVVCDRDGSALFANAGVRTLLGTDDVQGPGWIAHIDPPHRDAIRARVAAAVATGGAPDLTVSLTPDRGRPRHLRLRFGTSRVATPARAALVVIEEVTDLVETQGVRDRLARMLDMPRDLLVAVSDPTGHLLYGNSALRSLFAARSGGHTGGSILDIVVDDDPVGLMLEMWDALQTSGEWQREVTLGSHDDHIVVAAVAHAERGADGEITAFLMTAHDITHLKVVESDLRRLATHDPLTGLANRSMMRSVLDEWRIDVATREVAAIYCDLDGFKQVNDRFGHAAGDAVLVEVADRMRAETQATDLLVRLGGDEFLVLVRNPDPSTLPDLVEGLERAIAVPFDVDGRQVGISVSVGVAAADRLAIDESLTLAADGAMYEAKRRRGGDPERTSRPTPE